MLVIWHTQMKNDTTRFSPLEQDSLIMSLSIDRKQEREKKTFWFQMSSYIGENVTKEKKRERERKKANTSYIIYDDDDD